MIDKSLKFQPFHGLAHTFAMTAPRVAWSRFGLHDWIGSISIMAMLRELRSECGVMGSVLLVFVYHVLIVAAVSLHEFVHLARFPGLRPFQMASLVNFGRSLNFVIFQIAPSRVDLRLFVLLLFTDMFLNRYDDSSSCFECTARQHSGSTSIRSHWH